MGTVEENNMETKNCDHESFDNRMHRFRDMYPQNKALGALVIIIAGVVLLLSRIPQTAHFFPAWLFDWPTTLIVIGLFVGVKSAFRNFVWLILIIIGTFFLLRNNNILGNSWDLYSLPIFLILLGFYILLKRRNCYYHFDDPNHPRNKHFRDRMRRRQAHWERRGQRYNDQFDSSPQPINETNEDYIDINTIFGSAEKSMFTKTFKGGNIKNTFGGSQLNLSQADIEDTAVLNFSVTFGGAEITVPSNWTIQNNLSAVLGGIEDKRRISAPTDPPKILILRGSIFCGGVGIKN